MEDEKIEHESFAVLQINRMSGEKQNLFNSSIEHQHFIEMRICPAYLIRNLNRDWVGSKNVPYITIQMSNSQFAEAITSLNQGNGTAVTLKELCIDGEYKVIPNPPIIDKRKQFDSEFEKIMLRLSRKIDGQKKAILEMIEKMPKKYQQEMTIRLNSMYREISDHIPFIKKQFTEQMDKTTLEAKGEIEGFFLNKIHSLGVEQLNLKDVMSTKQLEDKKDGDASE